MKPRHRRLMLIVAGVAGLVAAGLFTLNAFRSNLVYFFSPTEVKDGKAPSGQAIRIGGMVATGTVKKSPDGLITDFVVTDTRTELPVHYQGILPDLFREGQGVVAQGKLGADGRFIASEVLAKHDEKYMPPEAAQAIKGATYNVK